MALPELALALAALLLAPGPTNTLLALAGAERGWLRALRLIPAEVAGYLLAVIPLATAGAALAAAAPGLSSALAALAALWVLWLALRLWRLPAAAAGAPAVTARRVFVTTLLNPKALVTGLVLLPAAGAALAPRMLVFAVLVIGIAALWAGLGAGLGRAFAAAGAQLLRRIAAVWLGALALFLASGAVAG